MTEYPPPPPPPPYGVPGYTPAAAGPPPSNNLALAIITTVMCCVPLGIFAIVKAAEVNNKWAMGDYQGALASAATAKKFSIIGIALGGVGVIAYFALAATGFVASSSSGY